MITFGIDISKLKFDVCYNLDSKLISKSFSNDQKGFAALQKLRVWHITPEYHLQFLDDKQQVVAEFVALSP